MDTTTPAPNERSLGVFDANIDVGTVGAPGKCEYDDGQQSYTITGAGANIWGDHDDFHFVWKRMSSDFMLTARAAFVGEGKHSHRKLGVMLRSSLDPNSPHVSVTLHGDGLTSLQFRRKSGAKTEEIVASSSGADVLQLERRGNTYIVSVARYGQLFSVKQLDYIELGNEVHAGLFVCSHEDSTTEQATFENVRVVVPVKEGFVRMRDPLGSYLELLDVETGHRQIIHKAPEIFEAPNWTNDGAALIYNSGGRLYRFDLTERTSTVIDTGSVTRNNNDHVLSFDGTLVGISSSANTEEYISKIYTVPVGGGEPKQVTDKGPSYLHGWSPDGKFLVYAAYRNGDFDVYRISVEGGEETRLTTARGLDDGPEYTPDGAYIYFNSVRSGRMQIWRMKPDGSNQEQVTHDDYNNWFAHISPDGSQIVFLTYDDLVDPSDHPAAKRVYLRIMPASGGMPMVLAYLYGGQGTMNVPSWSPDSKQIAFVSNSVVVY